jgi:hypothetical protein
MGRTRTVGRAFQAIALAVVILVFGGAVAFAGDEVVADVVEATSGNQSTAALGTKAPGATFSAPVSFVLECKTQSHADQGDTVAITKNAIDIKKSADPDSSYVAAGTDFSASSASIGPIPAGWPDDGNPCPFPAPTPLADNGNSVVDMKAPATAGDYTVRVTYRNSTGDNNDISGNTTITFTFTVAAPSDSQSPTNASISIDDGANWTNDNEGDVSVDISADDNVGVSSYRLAETQTALASASPVPVSPADDTFSRSNLSFQLSGSEAASKAVWLRVCDAGNNCADASDTIGWDKTAPQVAYLSAFPEANGAGWNNTDVVATFRATDNLSGFAPSGSLTKDDTSTTTGEGTAVTVGSPAFTDIAGNTAAAGAATSAAFKIDKTAPSVSVTGFENGAIYYTGDSLPTPGCSASDDLSGLASQSGPTKTADNRNLNGVGSVTYECKATDFAGNQSSASKSFEVKYGPASGINILQPINSDNTSVFSRGKSVPVKFQLSGDEPNGFSVAGWKINRQQISCSNFDALDAETEAQASNPAALRYDSAADQYIQNTDFKSAAVGTCWKVRAEFDNGQFSNWSGIFKLQK